VNPTVALSLNVLNAIIQFFARLFMLKKIMKFHVWDYLKHVLLPALFIIVVTAVWSGVYKSLNMEENISNMICNIATTEILFVILTFILYLSKDERGYILNLIKSKICL
jgi:uncharacterized membrane protein YhdT